MGGMDASQGEQPLRLGEDLAWHGEVSGEALAGRGGPAAGGDPTGLLGSSLRPHDSADPIIFRRTKISDFLSSCV